MNNLLGSPAHYRPRWLAERLARASRAHPVVVISGARQVGKSTLLLNAEPFRGWRYHSLDDFDVQRQAQEEPEALWAGADRVVLDEVQRVPQLMDAVKLAVDRDRERRFALSGSANLLLMQQVSESLAGRAVYAILYPMTRGEVQSTPPPSFLAKLLEGDLPEETALPQSPPDPTPELLRGYMPGLLTMEPPDVLEWWRGYVATYLERDLRNLSQIHNLVDFRRLMELLALRTGQMLNLSQVARDAGVPQPTAHRYARLLETTHLLERLPAHRASRRRRLTKTPKVFWNDPGLAVFLSGYMDVEDLRQAAELGAYFETLIGHHLRVLASLLTPPARLYYWRTRRGEEVDFVVEHGRKLVGFEVKLASDVNFGDVANLRQFLLDHPKAPAGVLLYGGNEIRRMGKRVVALPWTMITESPAL